MQTGGGKGIGREREKDNKGKEESLGLEEGDMESGDWLSNGEENRQARMDGNSRRYIKKEADTKSESPQSGRGRAENHGTRGRP